MNLFNNGKQMNEIVFSNRNKSYGAYAIRSEYDNTVSKSLGIVVTANAALILISFICSGSTKEIPVIKTGDWQDTSITVDMTPKDFKKPQERSAAPKSTPAETAPVIKDDAVVKPDEKPKEQDPGDPNGKENGKEGGTGIDSSGTDQKVDVIVIKKSEPEKNPDQMPELLNLYSILSKNIRYPELAKEGGISGTVIINFVIDEEGNVEKTSVLKGIGYGCDQEALRVVSLLPKWKPGIKNGQPVKVSFNLPIRFTLK